MQDRLITTNLEYYKAFYYAAKFGTITAAAQKLCLTQPTVTNAIQKLEEQLKVSLFVRYIDIETGKYESRIVNKNK